MLIKLWDWERKWSCVQVFEGHSHYVMDVVFNPKDSNQFASASLDRTVKVSNTHTLTQTDTQNLTRHLSNFATRPKEGKELN